jgi:glycosyltransferase involved in cell wall biosynthesis
MKNQSVDLSKHPLVSVIIPAYNSSEYIAETISSVLAQTYQNFEIIVINDGSKDVDQLETVLSKFGGRIVYLSRENGGPGAARNTGIEVAKGELIGFLDGDDIWLPLFLEDSVRLLKENRWDMIYSDSLMFGDVAREGLRYSETAPTKGAINTESIIRGTINVILSGTVANAEAVRNCGGFREARRDMANEDFDLWFKIAKKGYKIGYNPKVSLKYRVHKNNISGGMRKIAERGVLGMRYFRDQYDLSEQEKIAVDEREHELYSQLMIEKAKIQLAHGKYDDSITSFAEGRHAFNRGKLSVIEAMLRISPQLTRLAFKQFRPREYKKALTESIGN